MARIRNLKFPVQTLFFLVTSILVQYPFLL